MERDVHVRTGQIVAQCHNSCIDAALDDDSAVDSALRRGRFGDARRIGACSGSGRLNLDEREIASFEHAEIEFPAHVALAGSPGEYPLLQPLGRPTTASSGR
jgi:hypothetical protein